MGSRAIATSTAIAGLLSLAWAGPAPARAAGDDSCRAPGSRLVAADGQTAVWRARRRAGRADRWFACFRDRRRPVLLGKERLDRQLSEFRVQGPFVAYTNEGCGRDGLACSGAVVVRDLRTRTLHRAAIPAQQGSTLALLLSERGALAWVRVTDPLAGRVELRVLDRQGERSVATGGLRTDIDPDAVSLSATHVQWLERGVPRAVAVDGF